MAELPTRCAFAAMPGWGRGQVQPCPAPCRRTARLRPLLLGIAPAALGIHCDVNREQREGAGLAGRSREPRWGTEARSSGAVLVPMEPSQPSREVPSVTVHSPECLLR